MNYLAHAYLSFHRPSVLVGNMISDFVKGKKQYDYPLAVQTGIRLHRAIDTFTDSHAATKIASNYLKPAVGTYAGAFIDVVYDHFLALDEHEFNETGLRSFADEVYEQLTAQQDLLPEKFAGMLPHMVSQNWLYNYRFPEGIEKSFRGVSWRAKYLSESGPAFRLFLAHYEQLHECYDQFFPDVKKFVQEWLAEQGNV